MSNIIDFENVSIAGLESSPVSKSLAGLRANESRYFKNKYNHDFSVSPAAKSKDILDYVNNILLTERDISISSKPLETSEFVVDGIKWTYVFYESGLSINIMYTLNDLKKEQWALSFQKVWKYQKSSKGNSGLQNKNENLQE